MHDFTVWALELCTRWGFNAFPAAPSLQRCPHSTIHAAPSLQCHPCSAIPAALSLQRHPPQRRPRSAVPVAQETPYDSFNPTAHAVPVFAHLAWRAVLAVRIRRTALQHTCVKPAVLQLPHIPVLRGRRCSSALRGRRCSPAADPLSCCCRSRVKVPYVPMHARHAPWKKHTPPPPVGD